MGAGGLTAGLHEPHSVGENNESGNRNEIVLRELPMAPHDSNGTQLDSSLTLAKDANIPVKRTMGVTEDHLRRQSQQDKGSLCPQPVLAAYCHKPAQ